MVTERIRERRTDRLWRHCVYRIATGKWRPGRRLPSVREAASLWGVDRRTVLEAYGQLEAMGLVRRAARSGFFVTGESAHDRVSRHRHELARIHADVAARIRGETRLSPLGAFRYLAQLAAIHAAEAPECAFVECTAAQADAHAAEVATRLGVPCLGLSLDQLDGVAARVPVHVTTLLVSAFHADELGEIARATDLRTTVVPIEASPELRDALPSDTRRAVLVEAEDGDAHDISADVAALLPDVEVRWQPCDNAALELARLLDGGDARTVVLLSPRVWGAAGARVREHDRVHQIAFRIHEAAWPGIADAIGLPLGGAG